MVDGYQMIAIGAAALFGFAVGFGCAIVHVVRTLRRARALGISLDQHWSIR